MHIRQLLKQSKNTFTKQCFVIIFLIVCFPRAAQAGGTTQTVKVLKLQLHNAGQMIFLRKQSKTGNVKCKDFVVSVNYERVPWYSWLPLVSSPHPSSFENKEALKILRLYQKNQQAFQFGEISGLKKTEKACSFVSKGLKVLGEGKIYSFYYPL